LDRSTKSDQPIIWRLGFDQAAEPKRLHRSLLDHIDRWRTQGSRRTLSPAVLTNARQHSGAQSDLRQFSCPLPPERAKQCEGRGLLHRGQEVGATQAGESGSIGVRIALTI
jgi:hypothetical protein